LRALWPARPTYFINKATDHTAEEAAKRNQAMLELLEAQADYAKRKQAQVDWLNEQMRKKSHAELEYKEADEAMDAYFQATQGMSREEALGREPVLSDFHIPSATTKDRAGGVRRLHRCVRVACLQVLTEAHRRK
jgi:hypothetical protein